MEIATVFSIFEGAGSNLFWVQVNIISEELIENTKPNGEPIDPNKEAFSAALALKVFEANLFCTSHPKVKRQYFFKPSILDKVRQLYPNEFEEFAKLEPEYGFQNL